MQVRFTFSARSSDCADVFAIGLWQSLQASPRDSCIEPDPVKERSARVALLAHRVHLRGLLDRVARENATIVAEVGF
jgi:hypothetical protein